jgi:hypothetical protein
MILQGKCLSVKTIEHSILYLLESNKMHLLGLASVFMICNFIIVHYTVLSPARFGLDRPIIRQDTIQRPVHTT